MVLLQTDLHPTSYPMYFTRETLSNTSNTVRHDYLMLYAAGLFFTQYLQQSYPKHIKTGCHITFLNSYIFHLNFRDHLAIAKIITVFSSNLPSSATVCGTNSWGVQTHHHTRPILDRNGHSAGKRLLSWCSCKTGHSLHSHASPEHS